MVVNLANYDNDFEIESIPVAMSSLPDIHLPAGESVIQDSSGRSWYAETWINEYGYTTLQFWSYDEEIVSVGDFTLVKDSLGLGDLRDYQKADIMGEYLTEQRFGNENATVVTQPYMTLHSTTGEVPKGYIGFKYNNDLVTYGARDGLEVFLICPLCVKDGDNYYYGCFFIQRIGGGGKHTLINFIYKTQINETNFGTPELEPGEEGFVPTNIYTGDYPGIGGLPKGKEKIPPYKTDVITQPDEPDETGASAIGSGFLTAYDITESNLRNVGSCLFGTTLEGFLSGLVSKPMDYIVSLNVFPCKPSLKTLTSVKIGRWSCDNDGNLNSLGVVANGFPLSKQFKQFDFGTLQVGENFGSFLDYTHTTMELFLPFIGSVDIAVSEVMNGSINVKYTVDFFTGMCVANVLCTKTVKLANGQITSQYAQHSYQGNCAVQIPVESRDYGSMVGSLINGSAKLIAGVATENATVAVAGAGELLNVKPQVTTKGSISANAGFCSVLYPYIRVTRPIPVTPLSYQETEGYPSYIDKSLGQCTGLCVCSSINLKGVSHATDSELQRIESMCKEGVYV